jgi:NAD(P)H-quinone oxidoreductase subunit 5
MTGQDTPTTVASLQTTADPAPRAPVAFTRLTWFLWVASLGVAAVRLAADGPWTVPGLVAVDGLTVVTWVAVTFFSAVVQSYSRRYMAGRAGVERFFARAFGFTLVVSVLVAADHAALFWGAWLAMGLVMADLIGHVRNWPEARASARLARRYFLASSGLLAVALAALWSATGATTLSGMVTAVDAAPAALWLLAVVALVLAAAAQSALVPFHTWLFSSMTAPTPASALMHAGFVNAGGVLLTRFAPVLTLDASAMLLVTVVGATSALLGKLLKTVRPDVKGQLGCSTVGQMGFMILQAGLGFFGAAITHLVLHGFYKAYRFLSSGEAVAHVGPDHGRATGAGGLAGLLVAVPTGLAGGAVFAVITGKGTSVDAGLLLTLLVVVTTLHAVRVAVRRTGLPTPLRYGAVPLVALPAVAVYALTYRLVTWALRDLPVVTDPTALTPLHALVVAGFLLAYVGAEYGLHERSERLYVALTNAGRPPVAALTAATEVSDAD